MHLVRFSADAQGYYLFMVSYAGLQVNKTKAITVFSVEDEVSFVSHRLRY
jgi:hypothetical protein